MKIKGLIPGPKSHEISLMILHQIFQKFTEDPQVSGRAYRGCDLSKIPTRFLLKVQWPSKKIFLRPSADRRFKRYKRSEIKDFK